MGLMHARAMTLVISLASMAVGTAAVAAPGTASPTAGRPGCGDYSILANSAVRAVLEERCGTLDEADWKALLAALDRLDPEAQARSAASRRDYRLAAIMGGGPYPPGMRRFWSLRGIDCGAIEDADVVIWLRMTDAYRSATESQLASRMKQFAAAYNTALLAEPGFPAERTCTRGHLP